MPISAKAPDLNDKTVIKGQKGPSPYVVAGFCTVGFAAAVIIIVFAFLIPMAENVEVSGGELVGLSVIAEDNQILQVTVMKGEGVAQLDGLYVYFDEKTPTGYTTPEDGKYTPGTTLFYQFGAETAGQIGKLQIYGHFDNGDMIRVYTDTVRMH